MRVAAPAGGCGNQLDVNAAMARRLDIRDRLALPLAGGPRATAALGLALLAEMRHARLAQIQIACVAASTTRHASLRETADDRGSAPIYSLTATIAYARRGYSADKLSLQLSKQIAGDRVEQPSV